MPLFMFSVLFASCEKQAEQLEAPIARSIGKVKNSREIPPVVEVTEGEAASGSVQFTADLISAIDFIKQRGETPLQEDIPALEKEHVLILEMEDLQARSGIYASKRIQFSEENVARYMLSGLIQDAVVIQENEKHYANAVQFDKDMGTTAGSRKLRAFLFFNDLDKNKPFDIQYFDRIFGTGQINL